MTRIVTALLAALVPTLSFAAEAPESGLPSAYEVFVVLGVAVCAAYIWIVLRRKSPVKADKQSGS